MCVNIEGQVVVLKCRRGGLMMQQLPIGMHGMDEENSSDKLDLCGSIGCVHIGSFISNSGAM